MLRCRSHPPGLIPDSVRGTGTIQLAIHMLEGVDPDAVVYQKAPFTDKVLFQGRVAALWQWDNADRDPALFGRCFFSAGRHGPRYQDDLVRPDEKMAPG